MHWAVLDRKTSKRYPDQVNTQSPQTSRQKYLQGTVLGPLLLLLFIKSSPQSVTSSDILIAYDCILYLSPSARRPQHPITLWETITYGISRRKVPANAVSFKRITVSMIIPWQPPTLTSILAWSWTTSLAGRGTVRQEPVMQMPHALSSREICEHSQETLGPSVIQHFKIHHGIPQQLFGTLTHCNSKVGKVNP